MLLNQLQTWEGQPGWVHEAFKGAAAKVQLRAGFRIYKFNHYASLLKPADPEWAKITAWWSPYEAYEWDAGLENRRKTAAAMGGASLKELSRIVVAVREDWSSLNYLISASLTRPIFAFFGSVAPQARIAVGEASKRAPNERPSIGAGSEPDGHGGYRPGGGKLVGTGSQFYIPNLMMRHLGNINVQNLG